jgi:hypothetical protein
MVALGLGSQALAASGLWTPAPPRQSTVTHGYNDEGCPKNQFVSGYTRSDGTRVQGYWRNSSSDGCGQ